MDVLLSVVAGPRAGLRYRAHGRDAVTIGRSKTTDFHILDTTMSRVHAVVRRDGKDWYVEDQKSRNGVWINGERIKREKLGEGTVFHLGKATGVKFGFAEKTDTEGDAVEVSLKCAQCSAPIGDDSDVSRGADGRPYHRACRNLDHLVGTDLGEFRVVEKLEPLGDAFFFRAHQPTLNRTVILEVFDAPLLVRPGFKKELLAEVKRASRFLHPNILQIFDLGEARGTYFVVMEHFDAEPLHRVLERRRFVKVAGAVTAARCLVEALVYCRDQGNILPYVSPDRVLISENHNVKLKIFNEPESEIRKGPTMDRAAYYAPEVLKDDGHNDDERSTVYSVGAVLYHMLSGIPPFEGNTTAEITRRVMNESPPALRRINLKVSPALAKVVESAIDRKLEERPQTLAELLEQLRRVSGSRRR
jgi:serine/threonine protein kinase